jgi:hypothetical protein
MGFVQTNWRRVRTGVRRVEQRSVTGSGCVYCLLSRFPWAVVGKCQGDVPEHGGWRVGRSAGNAAPLTAAGDRSSAMADSGEPVLRVGPAPGDDSGR